MPKIKKVVKAKKENEELEDEELAEETVEDETDDESGDEDQDEVEIEEHASDLKKKVKKVKKIPKAKAENIIGEIENAKEENDKDALKRIEKKIDDFIADFKKPGEEPEVEEPEETEPAPAPARKTFLGCYWE